MPKFYIFLLLILFFIPDISKAQSAQDAHFTGSVSAGPNYYFNNIKTFGDHVKPVNYCFFGRIMWNSRYLATLGVETGYNKFYRVGGFANDEIKASLVSIPLHLVIGMKFAKSFYANFSFGPSLLLNWASSETVENSIHNKVLSYADGSVCIGYRRKLNKDFSLGAEVKFNFSTKAVDRNIAVPIVLSYAF